MLKREGSKYRRPNSFIRMHVRDAVYCTCRWILRWWCMYNTVHVQYSACTILAICHPNPVYSLYIRKFTHLLVTVTKLANWQNGGINVEIATKSACQIVCHPSFKTGKSPQNWQNLAHVYSTDSGPFQNWQKNWQKTGKTHTSLQSHKHQKRCPPAAPSGTTGGTTITSETRKTPSH